MNVIKFLAIFAIAITISACGEPNDFEWFPDYQDTNPPVISATISSRSLFNNQTTHVSTLPATVTFQANESATIYYTTNGSTPTTSSASVECPAFSSVSGPEITFTNTILQFFGKDKAPIPNTSAIITSTIKSP